MINFVRLILSIPFLHRVNAAVVKNTFESVELISTHSSDFVFGLSRGGGLFGGKRNKVIPNNSSDVGTKINQKVYPAMSKEEVENWLSHVPVYAVTDENGTGVVLRPENRTDVFYLYLSHSMANGTLKTLKMSNKKINLRVSVFSLGNIWFKILNTENRNDNMMVRDKINSTSVIDYRLIPDSHDLMGARMLLTMNKEDGERIKPSNELKEKDAQVLIDKAMSSSPKFNSSFNEIPIFMIYQMRIHKPEVGGGKVNMTQILPIYFNLQNMMETWKKCMSSKTSIGKNDEPAVYLMDLYEIVEKIQHNSLIDYRNIVLVPPSKMEPLGSSSILREENNLLHQIGENTLGDL